MYRNSELLEIIMKKYNMHKNTKINLKKLQKISQKEKIKMKDLLYLLEINANTIYKLKKETQKYTKLKFNSYNVLSCKKIIIQGKISKEEFIALKTKFKVKSYTLIRMLGISKYKYNKVKNGKLNEMKVIDVRAKHIVELIKLDFKYINKYSKSYYPKEILENICKARKISLDEFLRYYNKNPRHYKFNKMAMEQSEKGLWIGENIRMPDEFMNENYEKMVKYLRNIIKKYDKSDGWQIYKEDIVQDAIINIYEKCGEIVKKFYFDTNLIINIIIAKGKYIMFNLYRNKYMNYNVYYEKYDSKLLDHTLLLSDSRYDPQKL